MEKILFPLFMYKPRNENALTPFSCLDPFPFQLRMIFGISVGYSFRVYAHVSPHHCFRWYTIGRIIE